MSVRRYVGVCVGMSMWMNVRKMKRWRSKTKKGNE